MSMMSRVMRAKQMEGRLLAMAATRNQGMKPRPFESSRISDQSRFEDAPAPTEDDMISKYILKVISMFIEVHYLKHHPLYEFRDLEEFHVDNYRHWLHARSDYWNTETHPAQISPWEMGSKWSHAFFLVFPLFSLYWFGYQYKLQLRNKNMKTPIVGTFSQDSL